MFLLVNIIRFLFSVYKVLRNDSDKNVDYLITNTKRCGAVAIKLLQFISMRNGIKNEKIKFVFEDCEIHSLEHTKKMYFEDFKRNLSDDFEIDEYVVVGSGSIGQVYQLYSFKLNKFVALKSKHPYIESDVKKFINIIKIFLIIPFNVYHDLITEYIENIKLQLDYTLETENTMIFRENWRKEECVIVPEVYQFSNNFICMSYHEGENFNNLSLPQQNLASLYINFVVLNSLLVHDFLHIDLHTGNWKIVVNGDEPLKIVMYDCGIMCKTGNVDTNKLIMANLFAGTFHKLVYVISGYEKPIKKVNKVSEFIKNNLYGNSSERTHFFIKTVLKERLVSNKTFIDILTALAIVGEISGKSVNIVTKFVQKDTLLHQCLIYMYIGLLGKLNIFNELKIFLQEWMDSDISHKEIYDNWLTNSFGHTKGYILDNIIYNKFRLS